MNINNEKFINKINKLIEEELKTLNIYSEEYLWTKIEKLDHYFNEKIIISGNIFSITIDINGTEKLFYKLSLEIKNIQNYKGYSSNEDLIENKKILKNKINKINLIIKAIRNVKSQIVKELILLNSINSLEQK